MDGNIPLADAASYLSRLTGAAVTADEPLRLRSIHRFALVAWARKQGVPLREGLLADGGAVSLRDLMSAGGDAPPALAAPAAPPRAAADHAGLAGRVGIDIEEVAALPEAADFREHPFYADHFTPAEIAHCIRQPDARASLCGLWAAKEAILKSGAAPGGLKTIEISWDESGRPVYANGQISISHTANTAVAICLVADRPAEPAPIPRIAAPPVPVPVPVPPVAAPRMSRKAVLVGVLLVLFGLIGGFTCKTLLNG
jgi:phosphopantetheine--protein transferase-like protein